MQVIENFRDAMRQDDIHFSGEIIPDGKLHRFRLEGDHKDKNGWYIIHGDNNPAGAYGDWRRHISKNWSAKSKNDMTAEKKIANHNRVRELQSQRELETKKRHSVAAVEAKKILTLAHPVTNINISKITYFLQKKISSYGLYYLSRNVNYEVYPKEYNLDGTEKIHTIFANTLLVPCYSNGKIVNIERIYFEKKNNKYQKRPLIGGQRIGAYFLISDINFQKEIIYLSEGYSTGATIYESTGCLSVVSFNCGNLPHVAQVIRKLYPQVSVVIAGDRDSNGVGEEYAKKAASFSDGTYVLPDFSMIPESLSPKIARSDFNDLFCLFLQQGKSREEALSDIRCQLKIGEKIHHKEVII